MRNSPKAAWYCALTLGMTVVAGSWSFPADAQNILAPESGTGGTVAAKSRTNASGGAYYIEFRARYAWDYGHTYLVFGRVGEKPTRESVAGLSPVGDDATAWVVGHYVPVPAETGWTDGDLDDKYVSARYRVTMDKEQFDRTLVYIRHLQATSHTWSAELYNCNAFVGDVAKFMGLKVPASSLIYPRVFVNHMRQLNTGHPEAADTLVSDNVKEMSSPTRDGRAMINNHVYTVRADQTLAPAVAPKPTSAPTVIIGPVHVSGHNSPSVATSESSQ
jgi:hypothetical protein